MCYTVTALEFRRFLSAWRRGLGPATILRDQSGIQSSNGIWVQLLRSLSLLIKILGPEIGTTDSSTSPPPLSPLQRDIHAYHSNPVIMEVQQPNTIFWKTNDWNTLGAYPFSTKIRLDDQESVWNIPDILPVSPVLAEARSHSRHTSHCNSLGSEHAEEYASPQSRDMRSISPFDPDSPQPELVKLPTGQWQCPHCRKIFRRRDRGQAHLNVHINTRPYRCDGSCGNPICERSYFSQESLQSHTQHAMVTCDTCGKELRKKNISRHRKRYCNPKSSSPLTR